MELRTFLSQGSLASLVHLQLFNRLPRRGGEGPERVLARFENENGWVAILSGSQQRFP